MAKEREASQSERGKEMEFNFIGYPSGTTRRTTLAVVEQTQRPVEQKNSLTAADHF